jgi:hypothetical protein
MLIARMNGQPKRGPLPTKSEAAREWLINFLKDGPKPAGSEKNPKPGTVCYEAEKAGFDFNTMNNRISRGVVIKKITKNGSMWHLSTSAEVTTSASFLESTEQLEKSPESDDMVIITTVEEVQEKVDQIIKSKQGRLERINQQKEENFKKLKRAEAK